MKTSSSPRRRTYTAAGLIVCVALLAGIGLAGCSPEGEPEPPEPEPPESAPAQTSTAAEPPPPPQDRTTAPTGVPEPSAAAEGPPLGLYECWSAGAATPAAIFNFKLTDGGSYRLLVAGSKAGHWSYNPADNIIAFESGSLAEIYEGIYVPDAGPDTTERETIYLHELGNGRPEMDMRPPACHLTTDESMGETSGYGARFARK
jgi:hypothetical protein